MTTPIEQIASLTIGTVESVLPDEIKILLDIDSPRSVSLNTGIPIPFPRLNSFILFPNEMGAVIGIVTWLGVEKSAYPKRQGLKDFGLIDLPFPLRKMSICPIGMLSQDKNTWKLERGVQSFPSVGDTAIVPTREQTIAIVTGHDNDSRIKLGTCPIAHNAPITIDPDKLFGRHLAILGNTGSGKSCTVAALIRASIEQAHKNVKKTNSTHSPKPNARFIVLDPNGEYSKCFQDLDAGCRVFQVPPISNTDAKDFTIPAWMWNSSEWAAIAQAAPRTQRPLLQEALRNLRSNNNISLATENRLIARCKSLKSFLMPFAGKGVIGFPDNSNCGRQLKLFITDINFYCSSLTSHIQQITRQKAKEIEAILELKRWNSNGREGFNDFGDFDLISINNHIEDILKNFPKIEDTETINEDSPLPFDPSDLAERLENLAMQEGSSTSQFISTLTMRIKALMSDPRMNGVIHSFSSQLSLEDWLGLHLGSNEGENGSVAVIDLSLVPYEILHLVVAVFSRLVLESLQRYRKLNNQNLPTVLVLEEAHTFIAKRFSNGDEIPTPADMCQRTFERIAREGRKFGLGIVLSSQRPSELSETVLSQCNSFLLHRITNYHDQELISRITPDNTRSLLKELPSLPTRFCVLMGLASKIPTLLEVNALSDAQRPASDDPDFWDVWTHHSSRPINWEKIVKEWTGEKNN